MFANFEQILRFLLSILIFYFHIKTLSYIILNCWITGVASYTVTSLTKKRVACGKNGVLEISEFSDIITQDHVGY